MEFYSDNEVEYPGSGPEIWNFDDFGLWIQVVIGMIAIAFIGARYFCRNEEASFNTEPVEEEARGLFSRIIDQTLSFFG